MTRLVRVGARALRGTLLVCFTLATLAVAVAGGLAWRLSEGPIDLAWAARWVEAAFERAGARERLSIGAASLTWGGFKGAERGLAFNLRNVALRAEERTVAEADMVAFTLSVERLLQGAVAPTQVSASGASVRLVRTRAGEVALDGIGEGGAREREPAERADLDRNRPEHDQCDKDLSEAMAALSRPPGRSAAGPAGCLAGSVSQLRRVRLVNSEAILRDGDVELRAGVRSLALQRLAAGGFEGEGAAVVSAGGAEAAFSLQARLGTDGITRLQAALSPVEGEAIRGALLRAAGIDLDGGFDGRATASATLLLSRDLRPFGAALRLEGGAGRLRAMGAAVALESFAADAEASWARPGWGRPSRVAVSGARAVVRPDGAARATTVEGEAQARENGQQVEMNVGVTVDRIGFANLASVWPAEVARHARAWVTENLTAGIARDGLLRLRLAAAADFGRVTVAGIDARLRAEGLTAWWLRPVPPLTDGQATLTVTDPDVIGIEVASARQSGVSLRGGRVEITGLRKETQTLSVEADLAGPVADLLGVLRVPRLHLLSRSPAPMRGPSGRFAGRLELSLPLNEDVTVEQMSIHATTRLSELRLGGVVAGRDLSRGELSLTATLQGLEAKGSAAIAGIDADVTLAVDFRDGPPGAALLRATARARATARQLAAAGFDPGTMIEAGSALLDMGYVEQRNGTAHVQIDGDLAAAGLALAGWRKPVGPKAMARARVLLRAGRLAGIEELAASGPGMAVEGRADMTAGGPVTLVLSRIELGPTRAAGRVRFPVVDEGGSGGQIWISLAGPMLDLSAAFGKSQPSAQQPLAEEPAWVADLRFDQIMFSDKGGLSSVVAHAEYDGRRLAVVRAASGGAVRATLALEPEGLGRRARLEAADGGALLQAFDVTDAVRGGRLSVDGRFDDEDAAQPFAGSAELKGFHVRDAPAVGKLLQAATIYGIGDALSGPGLAFDEMILPFRFKGGVLDVREARATSDSLGLTASGRVDTEKRTIDLHGSVIPAYVINSLLGRLPILGRLFRAERGGGLIAVDFRVHGPLADPGVSVNPLSALTPGALRRLFHLGD